MKKVEKKRTESRTLTILLIIIMSILIVFLIISLTQFKISYQDTGETKTEYYYPQFVSFDNSTYISMYMPAVDDNGKGVITTLGVESIKGTGKVLVDIENLVFWDDTQTSIRTAKLVAKEITGKDLSKYDLIYNIHTNASMVGGPSAGAAITIATIAALENKKLRDDVMITGSVNSDGSIGQVSGVSAKARAAKQINVSIFLVPKEQSVEKVYDITKKCTKTGEIEYCSVQQTPRFINIAQDVGIKIVEVETIEEALRYFTA